MTEFNEDPQRTKVTVEPLTSPRPKDKKMTRRAFLKTAAVAAGAVALASSGLKTSRAQDTTSAPEPTPTPEEERNPDFMFGDRIYMGDSYVFVLPESLRRRLGLTSEYRSNPLLEAGMPNPAHAKEFNSGPNSIQGGQLAVIRRAEQPDSLVIAVHSGEGLAGVLQGAWMVEAGRRGIDSPEEFSDEDGPMIFEIQQEGEAVQMKVVDYNQITAAEEERAFFRGPGEGQYYVDRSMLGIPVEVLGPDQLTLSTCSGEYNETTGRWSHVTFATLEMIKDEAQPANAPSRQGR